MNPCFSYTIKSCIIRRIDFPFNGKPGDRPVEVLLCPDPTYKDGSGDVWPISQVSVMLITFWREISPPITLQKTQSVVQHWKSLATS